MISEADLHLLTLIRAGDADGWSQFIKRFQKRLTVFARRQVDQHATAEDLVQETLISFLKSINRFRQDCELETFLFQILRRKIVDHYRRRGQAREIPACTWNPPNPQATGHDPLMHAVATDQEVGWQMYHRESNAEEYRRLYAAIDSVAGRLREQQKFRDLKIAEGCFYASIGNQELATMMGCEANEIAVTKHRLLSKLSQATRQSMPQPADPEADLSLPDLPHDLLTKVWEAQRPSCPKRTTLGKYVLGILPDDWANYVHFHVERLGCSFCAANVAELNDQDLDGSDSQRSSHLFQSTIGFLEPQS